MLTDRTRLTRWRDGYGTHPLHIVVAAGTPWHDRVAFRDALRNERALARRYAHLKAALAARQPANGEAYANVKSAFVSVCVLAKPRG